MSRCSKEKNEDFAKRLGLLQGEVKKTPHSAWLIHDPIDLYYLTGQELSSGKLWVAASEALLLVDGRYEEQIQSLHFLSKGLMSQEKEQAFCERHQLQTIFFDPEKTSYAKVFSWKNSSSLIFAPGSGVMERLRAVKSLDEISRIKESAHLLWEGYLYIKTLLKEGVLERDVAKEFEIFCLQKGAEGLSFSPIIAFGENSALPHYRAGKRALKKGDVVLIDIGVKLGRYTSDMTRTLFFGEEDPLLSFWLDLAIEAQQAAMQLCRPGASVAELDLAARAVFQREGVEPYFVHSLGHGIGLEVHEFPRIRRDQPFVLQEGMVITLEPGLYLPGKGGVRYEDMVVITSSGYENLLSLDRAVL